MRREINDTMAVLELGRLRGDLEAFQGELMQEFYSNYAGIKDDLITVPIYERYSHLFSVEAIEVARQSLETVKPDEDFRWTRYLRTFSTLGHVENAIKDHTDKANTWETRAEIVFDGENIPYRMVPVRLRNEPDTERRHRLYEAKLAETDKLNEILLPRMQSAHDKSTELGFKNYRDMCTSLKGVNYRKLAEVMEDFLKRTEKIYVDNMNGLLQDKLHSSLSDVWSCDIPIAFKGEEHDEYFRKDRLIESFSETLRGMGIDTRGYENIHIDAEEREKKTPRAFCAPVRVPDDIRLVILPMGGWKDYEAFFHEGGHAWHFGTTDKNQPAEYKYLGDNSVTETFAFLFNYLPTDGQWLKRYLGMEDAKEFERFAVLNKLMFLRRYASKLIYEMKLHENRVETELAEVYRTTLQKGLKFKHSEKNFLEDVDDAFYCAEYLRAWIFEGQLRSALKEKFGENWFENQKTGEFITELWSYGQKFSADELVQTIGYVELDIDPVVEEIEMVLGK